MKQRPSPNEVLIKLPTWIRTVGLVTAALPFVAFLALLFSGGGFDGNRITGLWVTGCLTLGPLSLVLLRHNWGILVKEHSFVYTTFLGRSTEFSYREITYWDARPNGVIVHVGKRKLPIEIFCDYSSFRAKVLSTNAACTKRPPTMKKQLFHGYIKNPAQVIAVNILILVLGVGLGVILCCYHSAPAVDAQNTQVFQAGFEKSWSGYRHQGRATYFNFTLEGLPYEFYLFPSDFQQSTFENSVSSGDPLTVVTLKDSTEPGDRLRVVALRDQQREYLSLEQYNQGNVSNDRLLRWMGIGFLVLFPLFVVFSFYIINNAPRFPRLTRLLVKKQYVSCPNGYDRDPHR